MKDGVNKINAAKICLILAVIATILTIARYGQDIFLQNFLSEMAGLLIGIAFTLVIINWIEDHDKKKLLERSSRDHIFINYSSFKYFY